MKAETRRRTEQVVTAIRSKIANRSLNTGDRLPSVRRQAETMRVAPSTVVEAYDRLIAEGVIRSRPGSGYYVVSTAPVPFSLLEARPEPDRDVDPLWVSRQSLGSSSEVLKPGCGWLPADWMPVHALRRAFRSLQKSDDDILTDYGNTHGSSALRRVLLARLAQEGIDLSPEQLMLTSSGTQAIDLICRFLLREGDTVLIDDPCYFNFRALLRAHRANIVGVPYTESGPDIEIFEHVLTSTRPRLYITNSALHNPTGATLSARTAHRLLNLAASNGLIIVEDDIFADFEPDLSPRLATLDGLEHVIRIGSFSKALSASLRCGYIAARPEWVEGLIDLQVATNFGGPSPATAQVICDVLTGGGYRKHLETLRRRLDLARRETRARLARLGITPWTVPRGGFYLWCRLPDEQDAVSVARAAIADHVVLAPGNVFSVSQTAPDFMRFNVAQCDDPRIMTVLEAAMQGQTR